MDCGDQMFEGEFCWITSFGVADNDDDDAEEEDDDEEVLTNG